MRMRSLSLACFVLLSLCGCREATTGGGASPAVPAIVYEQDGDLYAVAFDGSRTVRLTRTNVNEWGPAVSPDASTIAFGSNDRGISTVKVDGTRRRVVTRDRDSNPAWAPNGQTIYFVRYRESPAAQVPRGSCGSIFAVSATGQHARRVTNAFANDRRWGEGHYDPAVSPDGRRIAFSEWSACAGGTASPSLRVVDTAGRPTRDLAKLRSNSYRPRPEQSGPAWSPDGTRLAFLRNGNLVVANRDGSGERLVARRGGYRYVYAAPAWSPDGRWIAFTKVPDVDADIGVLLVVRPDGTGLRQLARGRSLGYSIGGWLPRLPS